MNEIVETKRKHDDIEGSSPCKRRRMVHAKASSGVDSLDGLLMGDLTMATASISWELELAQKNGSLSSLLQHPVEKLTHLVTMFGQQEHNKKNASSNDLSMSPLAMQFCRQSLSGMIPLLQSRQHLSNSLAALFRVMQTYPEMHSMQMECLQTIQCLLRPQRSSPLATRQNPSRQQQFLSKLTRDSSVPASLIHSILETMTRFSDRFDVLYLGVDIVSQLRTFLTLTTEKLAATLLTYHMHQQTMNRKESQQVALSFLSWLVEDPTCRQRLVELGGVESCLNAMTIHGEDVSIQCNASAILNWIVHTTAAATFEDDAKKLSTSYPSEQSLDEIVMDDQENHQVLRLAGNSTNSIHRNLMTKSVEVCSESRQAPMYIAKSVNHSKGNSLPSWGYLVIYQTIMAHYRERPIVENCISLLTHNHSTRQLRQDSVLGSLSLEIRTK